MELVFFLILIAIMIFLGLNNSRKKIQKQKEIDLFLSQKKASIVSDNSEEKELRLIDQVTSFLTNNNLKYLLSDDEKSVKVGFTLDNEELLDVFVYVNHAYIEFNSPVLSDIPDESVVGASEITTRLNQFYKLGHFKFFYETRHLIFHNILVFYDNPLTEGDFMMYLNHTVDSCKDCRPIVSKVVMDKEEPVIAVMGMVV